MTTDEEFLKWLSEKEKFWSNKMTENISDGYPLGVWTAFWQVKQYLEERKTKDNGRPKALPVSGPGTKRI